MSKILLLTFSFFISATKLSEVHQKEFTEQLSQLSVQVNTMVDSEFANFKNEFQKKDKEAKSYSERLGLSQFQSQGVRKIFQKAFQNLDAEYDKIISKFGSEVQEEAETHKNNLISAIRGKQMMLMFSIGNVRI